MGSKLPSSSGFRLCLTYERMIMRSGQESEPYSTTVVPSPVSPICLPDDHDCSPAACCPLHLSLSERCKTSHGWLLLGRAGWDGKKRQSWSHTLAHMHKHRHTTCTHIYSLTLTKKPLWLYIKNSGTWGWFRSHNSMYLVKWWESKTRIWPLPGLFFQGQ